MNNKTRSLQSSSLVSCLAAAALVAISAEVGG
jgi:hypothetical protein